MSKLDDILKKSISGRTSDTYVSSGQIDKIIEKSRRGEEANVFNAPKTIEPPAPAPEPVKEGFFSRLSRKIDNVTARPDESKMTSNAFRNTLRYLPSTTVEALPFGVGEIVKQARDEPEVVANVNFEDVLQGIVDTSKGTFTGLIGTAASLYPKPLKFKVPILGEVTNLEYNAAQRVAQGDNIGRVILEEGVVNNIFGVLMLAGLANEVAGQRPVTIQKAQFKGQTPSGIKVKEQPKSFRLYEEPTGTTPLTPDVMAKLSTEQGIKFSPKYDPSLPTFFRMTGKGTGMITGEIVQVKPSYLETFLKKLNMDIGKVPDNMIVPVASKQIATKEITGAKVDIIPEKAIVPKTTPELVAKVEQLLPKIPEAVSTGDTQVIEMTKTLATESGDTELIKKVDEVIKQNTIESNKIDTIIEQSVQTPEKQLTQPEFTPYKSGRTPTVNAVYGNTPSDKFIVGTYNGQPYTTNAYILEFNSNVVPPPKALLFNEEVGANKVPAGSEIEKLIPKETAPMELTKVFGPEGKPDYVQMEGEGSSLTVQRKYYDYFNNKYKNPEFLAGKQGPIVVMRGGEKVGLLMPMANGAVTGKTVTTWEKPKTAQPELTQPEGKPGLVEGEKNAYGDLTNTKTVKQLEKFKKDPSISSLSNVAKTFEEFADFRTTVINYSSDNNIDLMKILKEEKIDLQTIYDNAKAIIPNADKPLSKEQLESLPKEDIKDYELYLKDKIEKLPKLKEGEITVIFGGNAKSQYVDTNIEIALNRGVNANTNVMNVLEENLKMPNAERAERGERILEMVKEEGLGSEVSRKQIAKSLSEDGLGSPVGSKTIRRKVEEQNYKLNNGEVQEVPDDFKISQRAKDILAEFGVVINEKQVPNKYLGFYKYITKKVRVQALYDVTTVTHEAIHAIDAQINFSKNLITETGRGADIRKQLTDIYEDIYPGAKREHPLDKRIKEGLAVFFENYFYDPASIKAEYPDLVNAFIPETGKYYDPLFNKLLERMNQLVDDYARLTPEQRFASRIRTGKEVVENDTGFTWKQRLEFEIFNKYEPLKRYGKMAGVEGTWNDPLIQAFNMMNKNAIAASWVKGNVTPVLMANGNFKLEKGTVKDYLEIIKKLDLFDEGQAIPQEATDTMTGAKGVFKAAVKKISDIHGYSPFKEYNLKTYRSYLVARRVVADNNKLRTLENTARELEEFTKTLMGEDFANASGDIEEIKTLKAEIQKLKEIIARDDFSLQDASAVVEKYTDKFKEADAIYDGINKKMIEMAVENELIPEETANEMLQEKGYASFRRYIDEDLNAVGTIRTSTKTKVSAFKERSGSQLDIIDPIYSQMQSINEIISKSMENRLWLKVADLTKGNPDIARRFEKISAVPSIDETGRITYPQEKQEGVIRVFRKGKREFYKAGAEFQSLAKTMRPKELDLLSKVMRIPSSLFTRLTTSANPLFAVGNLSVDQFSAMSQTKTGFKPIVDPAKSFVDYVKGTDGINAYIALGGKRQTLASFYDLSPEQIEHKLTGGLSTYEKAAGIIDYGISILEMPSNTSEIMTRYSEFKRAKDQGDSDSVAMYKASEVTTPFQLMGNLGGQFGQAYIKSIPYLNAQLQVLYKWGRASKDNPKRMGTVMGGLLVAGLTAAILAMKYATEEQKRVIGEQPVRNLSRYIYVPSPNGKDLIKFRIPEVMGVWTGMGYLFVTDKYGGNKATFDDYETVVSSTLPEQIQFWNPTKAVISYLPQALKPGVQTAFNVKVFPELAPIVPEYMLNKKKSEQYNSYSSKMSKVFGDMFNLSPIKSEFLLRNQFGVVGGLLVGKTPGNPLYIDEEKYVMAGRSYNRFYDDKILATQTYQDVVKDNPDKYSYEDQYRASQEYKVYNKVADILADMRKIGEDKLTDETKNFAYDTLIKLNEAKTMDEVIPDLYKWKELVTKNANVK